MSVPKLLVVGGNGFLGSAICRAAVGKGWDVSSMSSSGSPYKTPAGHTLTWVNSVKWHRASAFEPETYAPLVADSTAVVHTLGILLEDTGYKKAVREGSPVGVGKAIFGGLFGTPSPLRAKEERRSGYDGMNRDSALSVLDTYIFASPIASSSTSPSPSPRAFVYVSAADCFRPLIPRRYIESKREAEKGIMERCTASGSVQPFFMRPGLLYHPHIRPLSTVPAFLLSLTAGAHDRINMPLPFSPDSVFGGAAAGLRTHPLHVDHVAQSVLRCIERPEEVSEETRRRGEGEGVVDVGMMRKWSGFKGNKGEELDAGGSTAGSGVP